MNLYEELEVLTHKIENNTAELHDYRRYEYILKQGGLSQNYIYSYLNRAGFSSWEELVEARKGKELSNAVGATFIGALIGLGIGLIIKGLFGKE